MQRPQPITIELGEHKFTIKPLTCSQVQNIDALIGQATNADGKTTVNLARGVGIIKCALSRDYADVKVDDVEATPADIYAATTSILKLFNGTTSEVPGADMGEAKAA